MQSQPKSTLKTLQDSEKLTPEERAIIESLVRAYDRTKAKLWRAQDYIIGQYKIVFENYLDGEVHRTELLQFRRLLRSVGLNPTDYEYGVRQERGEE